jgi:hypothetical protein
METYCTNLLFLYTYEAEFIQKLIKDKNNTEVRSFNLTDRYIDGVLSINNPKFAHFVPLIYCTTTNLR